MDIIVQGRGEVQVKPDVIELSFDFKTKSKNYEDAISDGVKNVGEYFSILNGLGFEKEMIKTHSFRVSEETEYNEQTRKYVKSGFSYNQNAKLEFDYDIEKLSSIMEATSKMENPPYYRIEFGLKNNKAMEELLLRNAYKDAEFQAKAIARACNKNLILNCKKVSFEPFDDSNVSPTQFETESMLRKCSSVRESIQTTFIPEDISVEKTIYCLFEAH